MRFETNVRGEPIRVRGVELRSPWVIEPWLFDVRVIAEKIFTVAGSLEIVYVRSGQFELATTYAEIDRAIRSSTIDVRSVNDGFDLCDC